MGAAASSNSNGSISSNNNSSLTVEDDVKFQTATVVHNDKEDEVMTRMQHDNNNDSTTATTDAGPTTDIKIKKKKVLTAKEQEQMNKLDGMDLINYVCRKKQKRYAACVSGYYDTFIAGTAETTQAEKCGEIFELYRRCMLRGIRNVLWDDETYGPPPDNSALGQVIKKDDDEDE